MKIFSEKQTLKRIDEHNANAIRGVSAWSNPYMSMIHGNNFDSLQQVSWASHWWTPISTINSKNLVSMIFSATLWSLFLILIHAEILSDSSK